MVIVPLASAFLIMVLGRLISESAQIFHFGCNAFSVDGKFLCPDAHRIEVYMYIKLAAGNRSIRFPLVFTWFLMVIQPLCSVLSVLSDFYRAVYSISYISRYTGENYFYALFCLMVAGMNGVVLSGDLFNIFVFLEISVIASYALVAFGVEKNELEASFKYQVLGGIASISDTFRNRTYLLENQNTQHG